MAEAPGLEDLYQTYKDDGFIVITLLGENLAGSAPSQSELEDWADQFGLNHPVVADPGYGVTTRFVDGGNIGLPSMSLLLDGAEVRYRDTSITEDQVRVNLP